MSYFRPLDAHGRAGRSLGNKMSGENDKLGGAGATSIDLADTWSFYAAITP